MVWTHLGPAIYSQGRRTAKQIAGCQIHCDQVRALFPVVLIVANAVPLVKRRCQADRQSTPSSTGRRANLGQNRLPYL